MQRRELLKRHNQSRPRVVEAVVLLFRLFQLCLRSSRAVGAPPPPRVEDTLPTAATGED